MSTAPLPESATPAWWPALAVRFADLHIDSDGTLGYGDWRFKAQRRPTQHDDPFYHADARLEALQNHLYADCYAAIDPRGAQIPIWQPRDAAPLSSGPWRVLEQLAGGNLAAQSGTRVRCLSPGEYLFDGIPLAAQRGSQVMRHRPRWSNRLDSAFHYLFGASEADACSEDCLVRYYLAVRPETLEHLIHTLIQALDHARLPFSCKYPAQARAFVRRDALVLYLGARYAPEAHRVLARIYPQLACCLRPQTPLWTQELSPGLGFAQEPEDGNSFGVSRCRALAQGLFAAAQAPQNGLLPPVHSAFLQAGIDWRHAHLEFDQNDRFGLRQLHFAPAAPPSAAPHHLVGNSQSQARAQAEAIGQRLCASALWHQDRCSWITDDADDADGTLSPFARSMNGSLYDGSLGVAAFLLLLAEVSGHHAFAEVAAGALRHALRQRADNRISLYEGELGTLAQGLWLARRLGERTLIDEYRAEARGFLAHTPVHADEADLMHGLAGAILALIHLAQLLPDRRRQALDLACILGHRLVRLARADPQGWHWPAAGSALGLCGLSHGASGIALAFAALASSTPAPQWRAALQGALDYEAHWFIAPQGNWPHLFAEDAGGYDDRPQSCGMAWCHGAPGIALARLALWRISADPVYRQHAERALASVADDLQRAHPAAGSSYNLCHGLAGNADILLSGAQLLNQPRWYGLALKVARSGLQTHAEHGDWSDGLGIAGTHALGLMLGLAGTGYFLLRISSRKPLPSLLLPFGLGGPET